MNERGPKIGLLFVGLLAAAACGGSESGDQGATSGAVAFGESDVQAAFASFQTTGFARISKDPLPTQHGLTPQVVIWVVDGFVPTYRQIDPDDETDSAPPSPVGTMVVKQNVDASGSPDGAATVMAKFDAGFNPDAADWWWGRFDASGALAESGAIGYCIQCHTGNGLARTDYLRGVAPSNQLP